MTWWTPRPSPANSTLRDYRTVVRAYLEACAQVIQRFDGHIAKYLGDGILVYFGYPRADEHDAQRAIYAGLGIVEAIAQLNRHLVHERGLRLAVRLGIHTGLVVAGELGGGATREPLAIVGETRTSPLASKGWPSRIRS